MIKLDSGTLDALLAPYGLTQADVKYLGGGREDSDGIVYSFLQGGKPLVVKLMAWKEPEEDFAWTRGRCEERIALAGYLLTGGAPIVGPIPDDEGGLYRHSHDGRCGYVSYLMDRVPGGNVPYENWDDGFIGKWGGAVGRMHALAARHEHWQRSPTPGRDGAPQLGWRRETGGFSDWCRDAEVKAKWTEMETRLSALPQERDSFGFIHNDPHSYNILYDGSALHVIDFDVANYHWFMTDVAIATQTLLFTLGGMERPLIDPAPLGRFLEVFLKGYEREHHLDESWLKRLDLFIHYRRMLLFTVMQDWLETNADARNGWKRMIEEEPPVAARCL